jgi:hypothetical protein
MLETNRKILEEVRSHKKRKSIAQSGFCLTRQFEKWLIAILEAKQKKSRTSCGIEYFQ